MVLSSATENMQEFKKNKEMSAVNCVQKSLLVTGNSRQILLILFRSLFFLLSLSFFLIALDMNIDCILSAFYSVLLCNLFIGLLQMSISLERVNAG